MLKSEALKIIAHRIEDCHLCDELSQLRDDYNYKTVPGIGHPNARLMVIGEAPGEDEAEQGEPFVGRAGKLLNNIFQAAGWKREEIFITNILKCRPPRNRDPFPEEAKNCRKFLDWQVKCIDPEAILCLGRIASIHLLNRSPDRSMGSLRGIHEHQGKMVVCTYHPSYLLRNPAAKVDVWEDIQPLVQKLGNFPLQDSR